MAIESRRRQSPRLKEEKLLGAAKQTTVRGGGAGGLFTVLVLC